MRLPALKANIGVWDYYVTTLTFEQVALMVSKIDDQLHKSETLRDLIQRSITDNYISIKEYILNQPELFFNSLVLAVYDDYPNWREIEFNYNGVETYEMGLLEFSGNHKIFPVDGQHRVEGIKEALKENADLKNQKIAAIFIGHINDNEGKQKTRRLFTTLNRYAKPVSLDDIIALDEDDLVAILTRKLLEDYTIFSGKRVVIAKQKAIPPNNKVAITSIITLYQSNIEILKLYLKKSGIKPNKKSVDKFLKIRPTNEVLNDFENFLLSFWDAFKKELKDVNKFENISEDNFPAQYFRNTEKGGNMIFRPVGFLPLIKMALYIHESTGQKFESIFKSANKINFDLNAEPWNPLIWNPVNKSMKMGSDPITFLMLIYLFNKKQLNSDQLKKLKLGYAAKINFSGDVKHVLKGL